MNRCTWMCLVLWTILFSQDLLAGTMGELFEPDTSAYIAALSLGPTWAPKSTNQTFFLQPDIEKTYAAGGNSQSFITDELFLGRQKPISSRLIGQLGIVIETTGDVKPSGEIWEDADPNFNNSIFNYNIQHTYVGIKGQLVAIPLRFIQPYLGGSVGVAFNRASSFIITPIIVAQIPSPGFSSHTETAFSYTLNAGFQKAWTTHWQTGFGYEFSNWGTGHLSPAAEQTLNQGLSFSHLYVHQLQFTLIFVV